MKRVSKLIILALAVGLISHVYADDQSPENSNNAVAERTNLENKVDNNPFAITLYKPTYILPYYYTQMPDQTAYQSDTPDNQNISRTELSFQFSFKVPAYTFNEKHRVFVAYTQQSYWQAYQTSPFFRETDYQPEIFLANQVDKNLVDGWKTEFANVGLVHQSNGRGDQYERSWNRAYVEAISAKNNWMLSLKPWYVIKDDSYDQHNPDMERYMGHGEATLGYKYGDQVFSIMLRNHIESQFSRGATQLTWSFPINQKLRGYVLLFSGYGQSLIEYNHYTNSIGLGITVNDWI